MRKKLAKALRKTADTYLQGRTEKQKRKLYQQLKTKAMKDKI